MVSIEDLKSKLFQHIENLHQVIVTDTSSGCGQSFDVVVVGDIFQGQSKLQRCRYVNKILSGEITDMHAFGCKCYTLDEWLKFTQ